ncbi:nicotinate (nicotinamide) nucleotide adenylyltransferase [Gloeomargarita lithophora Alchichica-D10]|uniref:nicotinate-nucleotide adenylyltransferase n=1 Tax=Gloeomargarita lithophora Alchichica-D10 TaxID=1188229 RepID=A0A1J0AGB5_9CYAN|nr:nicotinate-nucleotide adenylyltransferase [Gloeomargarita lithophora]APB34952.1 nicotinate (nicotinamide) nucleotide adenylyltransferase [Gloeomargarita lithophora Alchichica-D10]
MVVPQRLALFGTSADPPTLAHRQIIQWLAQAFDLTLVWAADNPLKTGQTPLGHRMAMLDCLLQELGESQVQLWPELSHRFTRVSVARAQVQWPQASLTLALGADLLPQLPRWHQAEALFPQVGVVIIPRPGYSLAPAALDWLHQHSPRVSIAPISVPDWSSRAFREGQRPDELSPAVLAYIRCHQLYQDVVLPSTV